MIDVNFLIQTDNSGWLKLFCWLHWSDLYTYLFLSIEIYWWLKYRIIEVFHQNVLEWASKMSCALQGTECLSQIVVQFHRHLWPHIKPIVNSNMSRRAYNWPIKTIWWRKWWRHGRTIYLVLRWNVIPIYIDTAINLFL